MDDARSSPIKPNLTAASLDTVTAARDHNSRHPIHQLPVELLATILKDSIYYAPFSNYHIRLNGLLQVAWHWRVIIQTTPSMWSVVSSINPAAAITTAIEKSKMSLLDIHMSRSGAHRVPRYKPSLSNDAFLDLVSPLISQWRSFHLDLRSLKPILTRLQDPAPNLEEMALERHLFDPQQIGDVILFAGSAPRLQHVSLNGIPFHWCSALLRGLKSLALEQMDMPWTDLPHVLCQCPGLAHLSLVWLCRNFPIDLEPSSLPQITLVHLLHVRLDNIPVVIASCILHPRQMEYCKRLEVRDLLTPKRGVADAENLLLPWLDSVGSWVTRTLQTSSMVDFKVTQCSFSCSNVTGTSGQFVISLNYVSAHAAATWLTSVSETTGHLTTRLRLGELHFEGHWDGATICNMLKERYAVKEACADLAPLDSLDLGAASGFSDRHLKWLAKELGPGVVRRIPL
ncbi:hypothetical protein FRC04_012222 [Tulasnella sp. 424]|nr:hypothetical protein FRC04_012222 [Tulasnella sp. 424]KAG8973708.1 hypothetical protein FRC05_008296 [Tulasnella sp. 425]